MSENENVDAGAVPDRVLDELAEVLIERLDQLLDRLTDRALAAPTPGSAAWELEWSVRDTEAGRERERERSRVRAQLVRRAGAGLGMVASPSPAGPSNLEEPVARPRRRSIGRLRVDEAQLSLF